MLTLLRLPLACLVWGVSVFGSDRPATWGRCEDFAADVLSAVAAGHFFEPEGE